MILSLVTKRFQNSITEHSGISFQVLLAMVSIYEMVIAKPIPNSSHDCLIPCEDLHSLVTLSTQIFEAIKVARTARASIAAWVVRSSLFSLTAASLLIPVASLPLDLPILQHPFLRLEASPARQEP